MSALAADREAIGRFVPVLFGGADEDSYISLRAFSHEPGTPPLEVKAVQLNGGGFDPVVALATGVATRAAKNPKPAVFAPVPCTLTNGKKATESDVRNGLAVSVDIDHGSPRLGRQRLEGIIGQPATIVVHTGGTWTDPLTGEAQDRLHLYFVLSEPTRTPEEHARLKRACGLACALVGGDPSAVPLVHPMRWPGSWHRKGRPKLATAEYQEGSKIHLEDVTERLEQAATLRLEHATGEKADRLRAALELQGQPRDEAKATEPDPAARDPDLEALADAIPNEDAPWAEYVGIGLGFHAASDGSAAGLNAWGRWARKSVKAHGGTRRQWEHFFKSPPSRTGKGALVERARRVDPTFRLPSWGPERAGERAAPDPGFVPIDFASLDGREPPERRFVVKEWVPAGCVTGLWGEGGIGKSMLAQQIATAVATGRSAFGLEVETAAPVVGVFAEDDRDELWRRQTRINAALGIGMEGLGDLHVQGRAGLENTLALYPPGRPPAAQALMGQITEACKRYGPGLVILDNIAQLFGGNENDRFQVSHFCNLVGGIARDFGCAVLLLGHPSKMQGSEYSGSTAWNAAVRARMFLGRDKDGELRLARSKSNYAAGDANGGLALGWVNGVLRPVDDVQIGGELGEMIKRGREEPVENAFLAALDRLTALGEVVSSSPQAGSFAPKVMRKMALVGELGEAALRDAMVRLIDRGVLATHQKIKLKPNRTWASGLARKPVVPEPEEAPETPPADPAPRFPPSCRGEPRCGARSKAAKNNRGATAVQTAEHDGRSEPTEKAAFFSEVVKASKGGEEPRCNRGADRGAEAEKRTAVQTAVQTLNRSAE